MRTKSEVFSLMFWSTRRLSWREFEPTLGAFVQPMMPLLAKGTNALSSVLALGSMGTVSPGKAKPVAWLIGKVQLEAANGLKFADAGSHSLKSPLRMRVEGTFEDKTMPSRYLAQLSVKKKKV